MALDLLKCLLKFNGYSKDKYIYTLPNNIASQKVAIKNKGKLCYEGFVLKEDSLYYIDGIKEVKIYKISM